MTRQKVVITGGSGFVGTVVAQHLLRDGYHVVVPTRRLARAARLADLGVETVETDIHQPAALERLLEDAHALVNLVGVLHSPSGTPYGEAFARAHVQLPRKLVDACRKQRVQRLVHISALGAATDAPSEYQRSKADGEAVIQTAESTWTILRPSVIFGPGDRFLNLFARLARIFPVLPLAGANAKFQPVYVEDVAAVVKCCLEEDRAATQTFEVAGPSVYTLRQLVSYVSGLLGKRRLIIPLPEVLGMAQAGAMELLPGPLMSRDNVRSMRCDNVATGEPLPFSMQPTALETIAPSYIGNTGGSARP